MYGARKDSLVTTASSMYECSVCLFTGRRASCELHYIINHVRDDQVPWRCSLCGFRNITESVLKKHLALDIHKRALKRKPDDHTVFMKSQNPYRVEIGKDIILTREDRPNYFSIRSSPIHNRLSPRHNGFSTKRQSSFEPAYKKNSPTERHSSFEPVYKDSPTKRQGSYEPFNKNGEYCSPKRNKERPRSPDRVRTRKRRWDNSESKAKARRVEQTDTAILSDDAGGNKLRSSTPERDQRKTCAEAHSTTCIQLEPVSEEADDTVTLGIQRSSIAETVDMLIREANVTGTSTRSRFQNGFEPKGDVFDKRIRGTEDTFDAWVSGSAETANRTRDQFEPKSISLKSDFTATVRSVERSVAVRSDFNEIESKSNGGKLADRRLSEAQCSQSGESRPSGNEAVNFVEHIATIKQQSIETQTDRSDIGLNTSHDEADEHWPHTPTEDNFVDADHDEQFEEGLEDKVTELIQALEPLKNISKALIALDHHLRRVVPLLETLMSQGQPISSTTATGNSRSRVNTDPRFRIRTEP